MAEPRTTRKYWRESDAREFVEEHAASGMAVAAFAEARGIPAQRLKWLRRQLGIRSAMQARGGAGRRSGGAPPSVRIARVERVTAQSVPARACAAALIIEVATRGWRPESQGEGPSLPQSPSTRSPRRM